MSDYSDKLLIEVGVFFYEDVYFCEEDVHLLRGLPPAVLDRIVKAYQEFTAYPGELLNLVGFYLYGYDFLLDPDSGFRALKQLPPSVFKEATEAYQRYTSLMNGLFNSEDFENYLRSLEMNMFTLKHNPDILAAVVEAYRATELVGQRSG